MCELSLTFLQLVACLHGNHVRAINPYFGWEPFYDSLIDFLYDPAATSIVNDTLDWWNE
jgi:hypothetical protein